MGIVTDAQIVPDRATPRSTCSPVEDGQEISCTEIVTTSRRSGTGQLSFARDCNARTRPSCEDLRAEQAERRMGIVTDAQIAPARCTSVPCSLIANRS